MNNICVSTKKLQGVSAGTLSQRNTDKVFLFPDFIVISHIPIMENSLAATIKKAGTELTGSVQPQSYSTRNPSQYRY